MVFYGLIGLAYSFLAVIDPNSFGLVKLDSTPRTTPPPTTTKLLLGPLSRARGQKQKNDKIGKTHKFLAENPWSNMILETYKLGSNTSLYSKIDEKSQIS